MAAGDCELVRDLLGQPANTVSSLALVAAGLWLLLGAARRGDSHRWRPALVGAATVAAGVGSVAFHGPPLPGGHLVHDLGVVSLPLAFVATGAAELLSGRRAWVAPTGLLGVSAGLLVTAPTTSPALLGAAVAASVGTEAACWLGGGRRLCAPARNRCLAAGGAALGGLSLHLLGRTGGPLCAPASLLQPHAGWHVLVALAVALYASAALGAHRRGPRHAPGR